MTAPRRTAFAGMTDWAIDLAGIAGAALITYGVWRINEPAAFIVAGAFLLGGAWIAARKGGG